MLDEMVKNLNVPGAIGVMPTDTVYGVVARANDKIAVRRLYELKKRDKKPGTVIAANIDQLHELGLKRRYLTAVQQYWPNSLSVVIPCGPELGYLHLGKYSLAVRIPNDAVLNMLSIIVGPILTSSANAPGQPPASNIDDAKKYFETKVDFYIDGGDLQDRLPSTVIRVVDDAIEILREGAVKIDENGRITE